MRDFRSLRAHLFSIHGVALYVFADAACYALFDGDAHAAAQRLGLPLEATAQGVHVRINAHQFADYARKLLSAQQRLVVWKDEAVTVHEPANKETDYA